MAYRTPNPLSVLGQNVAGLGRALYETDFDRKQRERQKLMDAEAKADRDRRFTLEQGRFDRDGLLTDVELAERGVIRGEDPSLTQDVDAPSRPTPGSYLSAALPSEPSIFAGQSLVAPGMGPQARKPAGLGAALTAGAPAPVREPVGLGAALTGTAPAPSQRITVRPGVYIDPSRSRSALEAEAARGRQEAERARIRDAAFRSAKALGVSDGEANSYADAQANGFEQYSYSPRTRTQKFGDLREETGITQAPANARHYSALQNALTISREGNASSERIAGMRTAKPNPAASEAADMLASLEALAANPSPTGDVAFQTLFMKALDPRSAVREGELDMLGNAGSMWDGFNARREKASTGMLTPERRADMLEQARRVLGVRGGAAVSRDSVGPTNEALAGQQAEYDAAAAALRAQGRDPTTILGRRP